MTDEPMDPIEEKAEPDAPEPLPPSSQDEPGSANAPEDVDEVEETEARADDSAADETQETEVLELEALEPEVETDEVESEVESATEVLEPVASIEDDADGDAEPIRRRWWRRPSVLAAMLGGLFVLGLGGIAYATFDYSNEYRGRLLPGTEIAGVDVGGMTPAKALVAVEEAVQPELERKIQVGWKHRTWSVTPLALGAKTDARAMVDKAMEASKDATFLKKMQMRVFGDDIGFSRDVSIIHSRQGAKGFVEGIASGLNRKVREAELDYSTGWVEVVEERSGLEVGVKSSHRSLMRALKKGTDEAKLRVVETKPKTTAKEFNKVLLLRIGENKLYLYEKGKITHEWLVATGQPEYPTPQGLYEIVEKRYMPTWVNPDPEGWGADMPASIPPGPGNPLGTRALNWSADGIRFHGTSATYSLGYNASHGCVRMAMADVEFLYDLVDVGTPIVSVLADSLKPMYVSTPDPDLVSEGDEGERKPGKTKPDESEAD